MAFPMARGTGNNDRHYHDKQAPVPDDITELTGITDEMLAQQGIPLKDALQEFYEVVNGQEAAYYQASFDLMFLGRLLKAAARKCRISMSWMPWASQKAL